MSSSLARRVAVFLLAQALVSPFTFAQQPTREETRPRRTQGDWPQPATTASPLSNITLTTLSGPEPTIRVALTTDARSAVTTSCHTMPLSLAGFSRSKTTASSSLRRFGSGSLRAAFTNPTRQRGIVRLANCFGNPSLARRVGI